MQHAQSPEMSSNTVYFSVSQQYSNQLEPECLPGQPHIQECLETIRHCVGENLWARCGYLESHEAMVTGPYGHKATFGLDPTQPTNGTPLRYIRQQIERIEEEWTNPRVARDWTDWIKERIHHDQLIQSEIAERIILEGRELYKPDPLTATNLSHLSEELFTSPRRQSPSDSRSMPTNFGVEGTDQATITPEST